MADHLITKGAQDARRDWEQERGCFMNFGELYSYRPIITSQGYYMRLSCDECYVNDYNTEMTRLISEFGVPWWAPGSRIPSEEIVRELLEDGTSYERYQPPSKKVSNLLLSRESNWISEHGCKPTVIAVDPERQVLLVGGHTSSGFRVDIVDLVYNSWMHTYEPGQI
ncbi:hypothetical protein AB1L30_04905 [Bremerella sp. JC817]|uniref:hypothetical protein n=1 Tax=Bremerella sp. JC817 TaxID=3231756 RepID=UPI003459B9CB